MTSNNKIGHKAFPPTLWYAYFVITTLREKKTLDFILMLFWESMIKPDRRMDPAESISNTCYLAAIGGF